jgi:multidrug efflux pump
MSLSRFFIDRPIFAWVIAIIVMLAGALSITGLPIEQYPTIAPPSIRVTARYPGADATTVQSSVTQIIEQQLSGLDHLLYFASASNGDGSLTITVTFAPGTNPDTAQVQVQNKVQQAVPQLPTEVQQQGIVVGKTNSAQLLVIAVYDPTKQYSSRDISDYIASNMQDPISRVDGVGSVSVFGAQYAMRIWLDPYKLQGYGLMPSDVRNAITAQNTQVSAGALGAQPSAGEQELSATVTAQSRLQTTQQFEDIILKTAASGAVVRIRDVARVEMGSDSYNITSLMNDLPASGMAITLAPGANALNTVDAAKTRAFQLEKTFPPGLKMNFVVDNTTYIRLSIHQVVETLVEAILLVVLVMFVFLQDWRTTLVPTVAVPVVLLGTFGVMAVAGYSINVLTLFALVLSIGLLVDDAIVVVENVERIMREEGLSPHDATLKSMGEITGALIGISTVLTAVFLPMAFFPGSTGIIYRQFSVTIVSAMLLSVFCALVLTPALCTTLLRPVGAVEHAHEGNGPLSRFFRAFNRAFDGLRRRYATALDHVMRRGTLVLIGYALLLLVVGTMFWRLPTGFLPPEDQGEVISQINLSPGSIQKRTIAMGRAVSKYFMTHESSNVDYTFMIAGAGAAGGGQNTAGVWENLADWSKRPGEKNSADAIARRAMKYFARFRDARVFSFVPPSIQELGQASGFDIQMEDRGNLGHDALMRARDQLLDLAAASPLLIGVRPSALDDTPQLHVDIDQARANAQGVSLTDANATLSAAWGGVFVNNFVDRNRIKRVYVQGDAAFRAKPEDLARWYVRTSTGGMAPFSSFATARWTRGPATLARYNGFSSIEIQGAPAPGVASGTALAEMDKLFKQMPEGVSYELTGWSFQEAASGEQAPALYALSIIVIYLCLAALYESWLIPVSVLLVIPLGVIGSILAISLRGLVNDIYFQVGLLTIVGLSAKNAILIVEFAVDAQKRGVPALEAVREAAHMRLRPILMTSIAFIAGVTPLAFATGAGAASQNDIGTGVIGGMITATVLAIFFIPVIYQRLSPKR